MADHLRTTLVTAICLLRVLSNACLFNSDKSDLRPIGPTVKADILIYFDSNLSQEKINISHRTSCPCHIPKIEGTTPHLEFERS
jgi:hypothetical protein